MWGCEPQCTGVMTVTQKPHAQKPTKKKKLLLCWPLTSNSWLTVLKAPPLQSDGPPVDETQQEIHFLFGASKLPASFCHISRHVLYTPVLLSSSTRLVYYLFVFPANNLHTMTNVCVSVCGLCFFFIIGSVPSRKDMLGQTIRYSKVKNTKMINGSGCHVQFWGGGGVTQHYP